MFSVTEKKISIDLISVNLNNPNSGAVVYFDGRVRNHNDGKDVKSLEYQCYKEMALIEGLKIMDEAKLKFSIHETICIHREGHLAIGEIAVLVGVSSSHRKEAFEACQYIINEVKLRVPIWKKEHYVNQNAEWVACHRCNSSDSIHRSNNVKL